jgi:hypothetical protein
MDLQGALAGLNPASPVSFSFQIGNDKGLRGAQPSSHMPES